MNKYLLILFTFFYLNSYSQNEEEQEVTELFGDTKLKVKGSVKSGQTALAVDESGSYISFAFEGNTKVMVFDVFGNKAIEPIDIEVDGCSKLLITSSNKLVAIDGSKKIKVYDLLSGNFEREILCKVKFDAFTFINEEREIVFGGENGNLFIYEVSSGNFLEEVKTGLEKISSLVLSPDKKKIAVGEKIGLVGIKYKKKEIAIYSIADKKVINVIKTFPQYILDLTFDESGDFVYSSHYWKNVIANKKVVKWNVQTGEMVQEMNLGGPSDYANSLQVLPNGEVLLCNNMQGDYFSHMNLEDNLYQAYYKDDGMLASRLGNILSSVSVSSLKDVSRICKLNSSTSIIWVKSGINYMYNFDKKKVVGFFYAKNYEDWVVVSPGGKVDGKKTALESLIWQNKGQVDITLESTFEKSYSPRLLAAILSTDKRVVNEKVLQSLKPLASVYFTNPAVGDIEFRGDLKVDLEVSSSEFEAVFVAQDNGGGVSEVRFYHNNKLVNSQIPQKLYEGKKEFKIKLNLTGGINELKAVALNNDQTETNAKVFIECTVKKESKSRLFVVAVGINKYEKETYNLNYAVADATAFTLAIKQSSADIFEKQSIVLLTDDKCNKENIVNAINQVKKEAKENDVFIFYYAGHGSMNSTDENANFYLVPRDVTNLYSESELLLKGISATELKQFSTDIKAQKQLFVLDACQSGGAVELMASRGAAEEKAMATLARSTGTYFLTASGSEQYAAEFGSLGHGAFTYVVLQGLTGEADAQGDNQISVKELSFYIENTVPVLTKSYIGKAQYPVSYGYGQDFPLGFSKRYKMKAGAGANKKWEKFSTSDLENLKTKAVESEDYDRAKEIKEEIDKRNK